MYLHQQENSAQYLHDLIDRDRLDRLDSTFIDSKIEYHNNKVKEWKEKKKAKSINQEEIDKIFDFHAKRYQDQATVRSEKQCFDFLKRTVIPEIKRFGWKGTPEELDKILIDWKREELDG